MFGTSGKEDKARQVAAVEYLSKIGLVMEGIKAFMIIDGVFWSGTSTLDVHGFYLLPTQRGQEGRMIHIQAYPFATTDPANPLLAVWISESSRLFAERPDGTRNLARLLEQDNYGNDPAVTARKIADSYNTYFG